MLARRTIIGLPYACLKVVVLIDHVVLRCLSYTQLSTWGVDMRSCMDGLWITVVNQQASLLFLFVFFGMMENWSAFCQTVLSDIIYHQKKTPRFCCIWVSTIVVTRNLFSYVKPHVK